MAEGAPSPKEVFMYLDIVVEFQKRVVNSMDVMADRLHDYSAELTRVTRAVHKVREDQIEVRSDIGHLRDRVETRFTEVNARFTEVEARFTEVIARFTEVNARFSEVDTRLAEIEAKLEKGERDSVARFAAVGSRFEEIEKSLDQLSRELLEARSEIVAQNNQTINAVHAGLTVQIKLDEILGHLVSIDKRLEGGNGTAVDR